MLLERIDRRNLRHWMGGYVRHVAARLREPRPRGPVHVMFALCDHYEPRWGGASEAAGDDRVRAWEEGYPEMARGFRDADGRPPRHSFFFPGEEYAPRYMDRLARLAAAGYGEVELHLHHDGDTAATLQHDIDRYLELLAGHGHLTRDRDGQPRFAFIHGNWALANGRPDGAWCGVDDELSVLFDTGCYADFTFPSAPDPCQPNRVNQIYWPVGDLSRRRAYESGRRARVGERLHDRILMVQGPLALARRSDRWKPRIENGALTASDPPTPRRVDRWIEQRICVRGRPEWLFVKVHTHGASEEAARCLLGEGGRALHRELTGRYNDGDRWILHYVTAREMFNIACAAMDGRDGDPNAHRDYVLAPPPAASHHAASFAPGQ